MITVHLLHRLRQQVDRDPPARRFLECTWSVRQPSTIRALYNDSDGTGGLEMTPFFLKGLVCLLIMQYATFTPRDWMRQRVCEWTRVTTASYQASIKNFAKRVVDISQLSDDVWGIKVLMKLKAAVVN
jgi:hypothetical protein